MSLVVEHSWYPVRAWSFVYLSMYHKAILKILFGVTVFSQLSLLNKIADLLQPLPLDIAITFVNVIRILEDVSQDEMLSIRNQSLCT